MKVEAGGARELQPQATAPGLDVLVIVVNYRTPDLTLECLASIASARSEVGGLRAVVVDNGSGDGSAERIAATLEQQGWEDWASLRALPENVGFARGVNHGYDGSPPARWVLLLNSDARLHEGSLAFCCRRMEADPTIGAFSCMVLNDDGSIQNVARRFPTPLRLCLESLGLPFRFPTLFGWALIDDPGWDRRSSARDVDWLGGAFLLLRGDLIRDIGLLDGDFFFYGEDVELCHRIERAGFRCRYDPGATISHIGAASSKKSSEAEEWRMRQLWSARYEILRKCHGRFAERFVRWVDLTTTATRTGLRRLRHGPRDARTRSSMRLLRVLRTIP